ncbi:hypothetical protein XV93_16330 [Vibrio metoecus]|nr:hypothetical protein XV93_16330 [Vibrio metoecus]
MRYCFFARQEYQKLVKPFNFIAYIRSISDLDEGRKPLLTEPLMDTPSGGSLHNHTKNKQLALQFSWHWIYSQLTV